MPELFRNRVFLIVAGADLLQQVGIWIRNMALLFYVMEQSNNNPTAVAMLTALEYLPILVFSLIGGTFADRWNPKKTVIAGDALSAVSIAVILILVSSGQWQAVFAAAVVSAVVSQFTQPSSAVLFKRHVPEEQVGTAIGVTQSLMALFMIGGPVVGTWVYSQLGLNSSLIALIIIFSLAALIQLLLPSSPRIVGTAPSSVLQDLRSGFAYVYRQPNLRLIALMFLMIGLAVGITQPLDVFVTMERLQLPKEAVQWFAASEGIGMLAGGVLAAVMSMWVDRHRKYVIPAALIVFAAGVLIEVLSVWPLLTGSVRVITGITMTFFQVVFSALMIKEVAEAYIGRTNGVITPLMMGGMLLGTLCSGVLVKHFALFGAYALSAFIIGLCAVLSARLRMHGAVEESRSLDQSC